MPLTRADADALIVRRCGRTMALWGLDGTTTTGSNPDAGAALSAALMDLGITPASLTAPADADLVKVADADISRLLDTAEVFALEAAIGNADQPDQQFGGGSGMNRQDLGSLRDSLEKTVARKRQQLRDLYGFGVTGITLSSVDLGFIARCDEVPGGYFPRQEGA